MMVFDIDSFLDAWDEVRRAISERYYKIYDGVLARYRDIRDSFTTSAPAVQENTVELPATRVPEGVTVYAVGDVHGRADLLKQLRDKIVEDAASLRGEDQRFAIVFLGDYVDRGFQSRAVIDFLLSDAFEGFETRFLKGNHEEALVKFLRDSSFGPRWAEYGGVETLVSYNVQPPRSRERMEEWEDARLQLAETLPQEHRFFLEQLEVCLVLGDYTFVHAGLRPGKTLEEQDEKDLLWIRDDFLYDKRAFEGVIVHGHTPISSPYRDHRRIGVDTGAYMSGRLTAVRLRGEEVSFLST